MRTKKVTKLPTCDVCGQPAKYDVPTVNGPWANLCEKDYENHASPISGIGTRFKLVEPTPVTNTDKTVRGLEDDSIGYYESVIIGDEFREVTCPLCDDVRTLEPDAPDFHCSCGAKVLCNGFLI